MFQEFIRVTSVISPFSGIEFIPEKYLSIAANRGTLVHTYIESFLRNDTDDDCINPIADGYLKSFKHFFNDGELDENLLLEKRFFCDEKMITGAIDCITNNTIYDWKTSTKASEKTWLCQMGAYYYLAKKNNIDIEQAKIIKLNKSGDYPDIFCYDIQDLNLGLDYFCKCLDLYEFFEMQHTRKR